MFVFQITSPHIFISTLLIINDNLLMSLPIYLECELSPSVINIIVLFCSKNTETS